jgi:predicted dehydrogenase
MADSFIDKQVKSESGKFNRKLRMGLIGGGKGAFIGAVHHMAAILDNEIELVCGAFSSDPQKSKLSAVDYKLPESRAYGSYEEMILTEKTLPEGERMDFVAIVTPNSLHFAPAKLALENGFHVICDKPMTFSLEEAKQLQQIVERSGLVFALTHTYTGYPMVKEARQIIRSGKLGKVRKILVEYTQGWLATLVEQAGNKQASWRTDPSMAGVSCTMGDVGTHAENLVEYITGLLITEICADAGPLVPGRQMDDDGSVLLRFNNGAKGVLTASQMCAGDENDLKIRVYGELGGLEWHQMEPNTLEIRWQDSSRQIIRTGVGDLSINSRSHMRVPAGHPEGYIEAFANIYRNFAKAIRAFNEAKIQDPIYDYPTVYDGVRGMAFLEKVMESSKSNTKWVKLES